jgi:malonyl-CoA/methylmalonyl-CoA synthetase
MTGNLVFDRLFAPLERRERVLFHLPGGASLSGREFFQRILHHAAALRGRGVGPGDRVAAQVTKSPEALALYAATLAVGAVFLPLNTGYTAAEVGYFLQDASPRLLVCDPGRVEALTEVAGPILATFATLKGDGPLEVTPRGAEDLAAILYTSGTTGRSKGAMLSHGNLLSNAEVLVREWRFGAEDVLLHALPIFHTHGLFVATHVSLLSGGEMIFQPGFEVGAIMEALPQATVLMGVPTFYTRLLAEPGFDRALVGHMRLFVSGSAPLLAETHRAFEARTGHRILERYGMTETNMNTSNPYEGERRPGTVGPALPGVELRIMGPEGVLPPGEIGGIEVRGPNVFQGYWRMPEKTAEELRPDGWFITGDLGVVDGEGYVTIVGRAKDLVISGGYNIYPKEIEMALDAVEGVVESAVIGLPHGDLGEAVFAVIVGEVTAEAALASVSGELARFKQPRGAVVVADLPRNAMGKVQKAALRAQYKGWFG